MFWQPESVYFPKENVQSCLKVNKGKQRELRWKEKMWGVREIYNDGSFWPQGSVGESSQLSRQSHIVLGISCPRVPSNASSPVFNAAFRLS